MLCTTWYLQCQCLRGQLNSLFLISTQMKCFFCMWAYDSALTCSIFQLLHNLARILWWHQTIKKALKCNICLRNACHGHSQKKSLDHFGRQTAVLRQPKYRECLPLSPGSHIFDAKGSDLVQSCSLLFWSFFHAIIMCMHPSRKWSSKHWWHQENVLWPESTASCSASQSLWSRSILKRLQLRRPSMLNSTSNSLCPWTKFCLWIRRSSCPLSNQPCRMPQQWALMLNGSHFSEKVQAQRPASCRCAKVIQVLMWKGSTDN